MDEETGLYYYGARYLDPKYSMWISTDPALGEYIPKAPIDEEAKKHNQNLPGMGGVFNHINGNLYAYAGNNPVRYIDPDGRKTRNSEVQKKVDNLGNGSNKPISKEIIQNTDLDKWIPVYNNTDSVYELNMEVKDLANDETTMVDSFKIDKIIEIKEKIAPSLSDQLNYAKRKFAGLNTIVDERKMNQEKVSKIEYSMRFFTTRNIDSETGTEGSVYKSYVDINDDGNIDFYKWGGTNETE